MCCMFRELPLTLLAHSGLCKASLGHGHVHKALEESGSCTPCPDDRRACCGQALGPEAADLPPLLKASEVRCFEREGLPAALQLSAFPAPEETGVRYFRGSILNAQVLPI